MRVSAANTEATPMIELDALDHPIKAVTVFSSCKAEVIRTFTVELEEGQNEVHIASIPSCIDTDTASITVSGDAILYDDIWSVAPAPALPPASVVTSHTIKALERARAVLEGKKTLRGHAADILVEYGHSMNAETNPGGVESIDGYLTAMLERGDVILSDAEEVDAKIEELDWVIEEERKKLIDFMKRPQLLGSVTAVIKAKMHVKIEIALTYMVSNASWSPTYDLRATTDDGKPSSSVSLLYRAAIQQNTGEDWRNTSISVSTEMPGLDETIPALRALWISPTKTTTTTYESAGERPTLPYSQPSGVNENQPAVPVVSSSTGVSGSASQRAWLERRQREQQSTATAPDLSNSYQSTPTGAAQQQEQVQMQGPFSGFGAQAITATPSVAAKKQQQLPTPSIFGSSFFGTPPIASTPAVAAQQQQQQQKVRIQSPSSFGPPVSSFGNPAVESTPTVAAQQQQQVRTLSLFGQSAPVASSPLFGNTTATPPGAVQQQQASPVTSKHSEDSASVNTSSASSTGKNLGLVAASGSRTHAKKVNGKADAVDDSKGSWIETRALVTESAVPSVFHIEGNCSIPSEPIPHKVVIATLELDAKMNYVVVPRTAPSAFLQCEVTNTSEFRLLPGPMNVYLDNRPVSKASISDVNREESFQCTLGSDPSIRIKCTRLPRTLATSSSQYTAQTLVATYKLQTEVQNTHSFPISGLVIRDAAPTPAPAASSATTAASSRSGIKVTLKRPEGLGEAEPGDVVPVDVSGGEKGKGSAKVKVRWPSDSARRLGKYEWVVSLGVGEKVTLDAEYDIRAPSDVKWVLSNDFYTE